MKINIVNEKAKFLHEVLGIDQDGLSRIIFSLKAVGLAKSSGMSMGQILEVSTRHLQSDNETLLFMFGLGRDTNNVKSVALDISKDILSQLEEVFRPSAGEQKGKSRSDTFEESLKAFYKLGKTYQTPPPDHKGEPELVDVVRIDLYRDGGTAYYEDRAGRSYWTLAGRPHSEVYDSMGTGRKRLKVRLNVVPSFT